MNIYLEIFNTLWFIGENLVIGLKCYHAIYEKVHTKQRAQKN